jgi:hypothetical protein
MPYQPYPAAVVIADPKAPARRASILLFVLGALLVLIAVCVVAVSFVPVESLPAADRTKFEEMMSQSGRSVSLQEVMGFYRVAGGVLLVPAFAMLVVGIGVIRNRPGWIVTAIVVTSVMLAVFAIITLLMVVGMFTQPQMAPCICVTAIPTSLLGLELAWLISALRANRSVPPAYATQTYWSAPPGGYPGYSQGQLPPGYGYGYGYGHPPDQPPPPPPAGSSQQPPPDVRP